MPFIIKGLRRNLKYMGGCLNYGPFLGYPKRGHNFDNYPYLQASMLTAERL